MHSVTNLIFLWLSTLMCKVRTRPGKKVILILCLGYWSFPFKNSCRLMINPTFLSWLNFFSSNHYCECRTAITPKYIYQENIQIFLPNNYFGELLTNIVFGFVMTVSFYELFTANKSGRRQSKQKHIFGSTNTHLFVESTQLFLHIPSNTSRLC